MLLKWPSAAFEAKSSVANTALNDSIDVHTMNICTFRRIESANLRRAADAVRDRRIGNTARRGTEYVIHRTAQLTAVYCNHERKQTT